MSNWGASKTDWQSLGQLAPDDIWPTVNNPRKIVAATRKDPGGYLTEGKFAKTPSQLTADDKAVRIPAWPKVRSTQRQREISPRPWGCFQVFSRSCSRLSMAIIFDPLLANKIDPPLLV